MRIVIATDSFKESLSSAQVGTALAKGLQKVLDYPLIDLVPIADGGEGTVEAIVKGTGGKYVNIVVHDPLMRKIDSFYGITGNGKTAIIEMAAASGLTLLKPEERNPCITTTYGTGELIKDALLKGCSTIITGMGGSATNDGGSGMAKALGAKFIDENGLPVRQGGGYLSEIKKIDLSLLDERITSCTFYGASDVENPLTGDNGASLIYSMQKGADRKMAKKLEANMIHYCNLLNIKFCTDFSEVKGGGAAGGLGVGLIAFLHAKLKPGFEIINEIINLEKKIAESDFVITGEGKIDHQTAFGKAPYRVALLAKKHNKPVFAVCGINSIGNDAILTNIFDAVFSLTDNEVTIEKAISEASQLCVEAGRKIGKLLISKIKKNEKSSI